MSRIHGVQRYHLSAGVTIYLLLGGSLGKTISLGIIYHDLIASLGKRLMHCPVIRIDYSKLNMGISGSIIVHFSQKITVMCFYCPLTITSILHSWNYSGFRYLIFPWTKWRQNFKWNFVNENWFNFDDLITYNCSEVWGVVAEKSALV